MAKICQIATVLYDVLKTFLHPEKIDHEVSVIKCVIFLVSSEQCQLENVIEITKLLGACRHEDTLQTLRRKENNMSATTFFHCMPLVVNQQLWNFLRLYTKVHAVLMLIVPVK